MHKYPWANPRIGKNKANSVVDASYSEFVGIEEQWSNGKAGGVGTGALISASRRRVHTIEIPHREKGCRERVIGVVSLPGFVKLAVAAVNHDQVAVTLIAMVSGLIFEAAADGKRYGGDYVVGRVRVQPLRKGTCGVVAFACNTLKSKPTCILLLFPHPPASLSQLMMVEDWGSSGA